MFIAKDDMMMSFGLLSVSRWFKLGEKTVFRGQSDVERHFGSSKKGRGEARGRENMLSFYSLISRAMIQRWLDQTKKLCQPPTMCSGSPKCTVPDRELTRSYDKMSYQLLKQAQHLMDWCIRIRGTRKNAVTSVHQLQKRSYRFKGASITSCYHVNLRVSTITMLPVH